MRHKAATAYFRFWIAISNFHAAFWQHCVVCECVILHQKKPMTLEKRISSIHLLRRNLRATPALLNATFFFYLFLIHFLLAIKLKVFAHSFTCRYSRYFTHLCGSLCAFVSGRFATERCTHLYLWLVLMASRPLGLARLVLSYVK